MLGTSALMSAGTGTDLGRLGYSVLRVPAALVMKDIVGGRRAWCAARWTSAAADARSNCRIKLTSFARSLSGALGSDSRAPAPNRCDARTLRGVK